MSEAAYNAQIVKPLSKWLRLIPSDRSFRLPLVGKEGRRVLFIQSGDITDLLFASPLLAALSRSSAPCRIGVLVREDSSELIRHHPHVHDMLTYRPGSMNVAHPNFFKLVRQIRKRDYDMIIHMGESPPSAHEILGYLCGAAVRIGPAHERSYPYINCELRWDPGKSGYEGHRLAEVARLLGVALDDDRRAAVLTDQDVRFARQLVHFRKPRNDQILIGVDPGRGKSQTRVRTRTMAYLVNAIYQRYRSKVIVLATPEEDEAAAHFEQSIQCERIDLPRHNVKDVVALLSQCDVFLAGNTNLMHFAVAFGVPTVSLFTDRDDRRWLPPQLPHLATIRGRRGAKLSLDGFLGDVERLLSLPSGR